MKNELTAKRLRIALSNNSMKPQELADKTGVNKASISQYINGSHKPSNISAGKIGEALNVEPLWLMGFDVPMERGKFKDAPEKAHLSFDNVEAFKKAYEQNKYLKGERELLDVYRKLSEENKGKTIQYSKGLLSVQNMELQVNAAHNSKGEFTEDERREDENMLD